MPPVSALAHKRPKPCIHRITLRAGQPPVSLDDLALMLEIDLALGRKLDFNRRLRRALGDAWRQGKAS